MNLLYYLFVVIIAYFFIVIRMKYIYKKNTTSKIREIYEAYKVGHNADGIGDWKIYNRYKCDNCGHAVKNYSNYCEMCGFKFIGIKDVNIVGRIKE